MCPCGAQLLPPERASKPSEAELKLRVIEDALADMIDVLIRIEDRLGKLEREIKEMKGGASG